MFLNIKDEEHDNSFNRNMSITLILKFSRYTTAGHYEFVWNEFHDTSTNTSK